MQFKNNIYSNINKKAATNGRLFIIFLEINYMP